MKCIRLFINPCSLLLLHNVMIIWVYVFVPIQFFLQLSPIHLPNMCTVINTHFLCPGVPIKFLIIPYYALHPLVQVRHHPCQLSLFLPLHPMSHSPSARNSFRKLLLRWDNWTLTTEWLATAWEDNRNFTWSSLGRFWQIRRIISASGLPSKNDGDLNKRRCSL